MDSWGFDMSSDLSNELSLFLLWSHKVLSPMHIMFLFYLVGSLLSFITKEFIKNKHIVRNTERTQK